jgi:chorismate mutase / prephenate dehydrogenase
MSKIKLDKLRAEINQIDYEVLQLAKKRLSTVQEISQLKNALGFSIRDFSREKQCLDFSEKAAKELKLSPQFAKEILHLFMQESLSAQERDRLAGHSILNKKRALILGGAGKMGLWFARFLSSQGFDTEISDPQIGDAGFINIYPHTPSALSHDIIVVAAPLSVTAKILEDISQDPPRGLIFDIGSLKDPIRPGLDLLFKAGARVTSIHPMFGPNTELLADRHVIVVDVGHSDANLAAASLFTATTVKINCMDIDEHDRLMAYLLGLSHALNIAFFSVLAQSGETATKLMNLSSSTFDSQLKIANNVAEENPHLYFEIQSLNPYGDESLQQLASVIDNMRHLIRVKDQKSFTKLMQDGYNYLTLRQDKRT